MVRTYKRRTERQSWNTDNMEAAIQAVREGSCKKTAARDFGVPIMALKRRLNNKIYHTEKRLGRFDCVFNKAQEVELVNHILHMETCMCGMTTRNVRCLAYQLTEKNHIKHPFSKAKQAAGQDWFTAFKKRHPELTIRSPEATSVARGRAFNKPVVTKFYALLKTVVVEKKLPAHRIFNVDETCINTVPGKNSKVVAKTGRKQVARITSAERGVSTTAVICASAGGNFVPPLIIFKCKRMKKELKDGAPPGAIFACNDSEWMKIEVFSEWFDHFKMHTKPTAEDPVLLILDGHNSHTKNLNVITKAREHNVTILCLPPHTTHRLRPLDVAVMFPLNRYLDQNLEKWLNNHPGRTISVFQMSSIFCEAYLKACTPENAVNGFRKTGIFPFDDNLFTDIDFVAAEVTDIDPPNVATVFQNEPDQNLNSHPLTLTVLEPIPSTSSAHSPEPYQCTPHASPPSQEGASTTPSSSFLTVSPSNIRPIPKIVGPRKVITRKTGKSAIITSSPYKNELEDEIQKKEQTELMKKRRRENKKKQMKGIQQKSKKQKRISKPSSTSKYPFKEDEASTSSSSEENDDAQCLICQEMYSASYSGEGWIQCTVCSLWAHDACAGVEDNDDTFTCDICN